MREPQQTMLIIMKEPQQTMLIPSAQTKLCFVCAYVADFLILVIILYHRWSQNYFDLCRY